jgi:ABC-type oligopeptide transport system substrate-binding subunit
MKALHLRVRFALGQWVDQEKSARAGQLMMWFLSWNAGIPDGNEFLGLGYGPNKGADNLSRFDLPAYNALIERERALPDGRERLAVMRQAQRMLVAYMPLKAEVHRIGATLQHPWIVGLRPHPFLYAIWKYLDVAP